MAKKTFQDIINSDTPTLVDFHAEWCGPCKSMSPIIQQLKEDLGEQAQILKVDIDRNPKAADVFQVRGVPTFILFKNGQVVWRQSGMQPLHQLKQVILGNTAS